MTDVTIEPSTATAAAAAPQTTPFVADDDITTASQHMADAARRIKYLHQGRLSSTNNIVVKAVAGDEDDDGIVTTAGESVTISRKGFLPDDDDAPMGESVLAGLTCVSASTPICGRQRGTTNKKKSNGTRVKRNAAELMCLTLPSSAVVEEGCSRNPLVSSHKPYSLVMVHSSETNVGYLLSPPKPKRTTKRSVSDSSAILNSSVVDTNTISAMHHVSSIAFKATVAPPSLRAITGSQRARVERFDYAKALLRSDEELEKLSQRIRKEINESELYELALAAERAAEAGEEKFAGRASTFGGEQQHNHHKYQPQPQSTRSKCTHHNIKAGQTSSMTAATGASPSSFVKRKRDTSDREKITILPIPTIGTTPHTPDRRIDGSLVSSPSLLISPSERSLLEAFTAVPTPQEPPKRSMGVDSLRDVNEVIPHWKELHEHMRTHLYRASVQEKILFFPDDRTSRTKTEDPTTTTSLPSDSANTKASPQHRRSRSFFESLADLTISRFGGDCRRERQRQIVSTGSFDAKMHTDLTEEVYDDVSASEPSETSARLEKNGPSTKSHVDATEGATENFTRLNAINHAETLSGIGNTNSDSSMRVSSYVNDFQRLQNNCNTAFLAEKVPWNDDPTGLKMTMDRVSAQPRNRSACSSETSSIISNDSDDDDIDATNSAHPRINECIPSEEVVSTDTSLINSEKAINPSIVDHPPLDSTVSPASLMDDDISVPPNSPIRESCSTNVYGNHNSDGTMPLTPTSSTLHRSTDLGFNTPAHLRIIKGMKNGDAGRRKMQDAPHQPEMGEGRDNDLEITPAVNYQHHFEPNSIVDSRSGRPSGYIERMKPSLPESETRYLALPAISSSASDSNLKKMPSRRIHRRKINRTQWLDSPTTPTDQMERVFLQPVKLQQDDFLSKTTSYMEMPVSIPNHDGLEVRNHTFDETFQPRKETDPSSSGTTLHIPHAMETNAEAVGLFQQSPASGSASSSVFSHQDVESTQYREEKKECEDFGQATFSPRKTTSEVDVLSTPMQHNKEVSSVAFLPLHDSRDDGDRINNRVLVHSLSAPDSPFQEENSMMNYSFNTTKSAPQNMGKGENAFTSVLKRTGTWDGVVSTDSIDPISAVNSFINSTSAAVNDAAVFLADITTGDDKDSNDNLDTHVGSSLLRENRSSCVVRGNALCHGDEHFKAAVQGVLSHLSLSPRHASQTVPEVSLFLAESENKEFLQNYFYCTKQHEHNKVGNGNESQLPNSKRVERLGGEHVDIDNFSSPGGIACAAEPCNGNEANCHMLGVDAVCSGLTFLFPTSRDYDESNRTNVTTRISHNSSSGTSATTHRYKAFQQMPQQHRPRSASFSQNDLFASSTQAIDLQDQHGASAAASGHGMYGQQESWLGMFQRVASSSTRRFSFANGDSAMSDDILSNTRHPFTPPCLTRRVLTRNQAG
ncbi:hypothetical protein IV203_024087 [Nitzschia inconspicua]|uniref:Uncharacterized protein n=1 Tax=Nitzschia inconspicua TaxID=303405 RepID=A0A9K3PCZ3_9STRA|nr:hypothetical protein IV203_024087 [Nitzschia inconspicua]